MSALSTWYCLVIYHQTRRWPALIGSYLFFALAAFSRDYGVVLLAPVAAIWVIESRGAQGLEWRKLLSGITPYVLIALIYLGIRTGAIVDVELLGDSDYQVSFNVMHVSRGLLVFWGEIWNLPFNSSLEGGVGSFATLLAFIRPGIGAWVTFLEWAFLLAASGLFAVTAFRASRIDSRLWVPVLWTGAFLGPPLVIQVMREYYILEPMTGISIFVAMSLNAWHPIRWRLLAPWLVVLLVSVLNGLVHSQRIDALAWRYSVDLAENAYETIAPAAGASNVQRVTLVCANEDQKQWWWAIMAAGGAGPMVPYLLGKPDLSVDFVLPAKLPQVLEVAGPEHVIFVQKGNTFARFTGSLHPALESALAKLRVAEANNGSPNLTDTELQHYLLTIGDEVLIRKRAAEFWTQSQHSQAVEFLEPIVDRNPLSAEAAFCLAFSYQQSRQFTKALEVYNRALRLGSSEVWVRYYRSMVPVALGDSQKARSDLQRARGIDPSHEGVKRYLEKLEAEGL